MKWRLTSTGPVHLRSWDDEYVLYDCRTGDTHQLTWLAATVLLQLERAPADAAMLLASLDISNDPEDASDQPDTEVRAAVDAVIDTLSALELIEQAVA